MAISPRISGFVFRDEEINVAIPICISTSPFQKEGRTVSGIDPIRKTHGTEKAVHPKRTHGQKAEA